MKENKKFILKDFIVVTLLTSIWILIGEVLRAMLVAFPLMKDFFGDRIAIGPMAVSNALVWGLWSIIITAVLVFVFWLCINAFGSNFKSVLISSTVTCLATIGVFWIANVNTGLGEWSTAFILFPIAWVEMVVGAHIAQQLYKRREAKTKSQLPKSRRTNE